MYNAFFDGACEWWRDENGKNRRNPGGIATYGWLIYQDKDLLARGWGEVCRGDGATNNVAEYTALLKLIEAFEDLKLDGALLIRGDSQLVIRQMTGIYRVKSQLLRPLYNTLVTQTEYLDIQFVWVRRDYNEEADALSKLAYREAQRRSEIGAWEKRFRYG